MWRRRYITFSDNDFVILDSIKGKICIKLQKRRYYLENNGKIVYFFRLPKEERGITLSFKYIV